MRAKKVYEFQKTGDVKDSLNIGWKPYIANKIANGESVESEIIDKNKEKVLSLIDYINRNFQIDEEMASRIIQENFYDSSFTSWMDYDDIINLYLHIQILGVDRIKIIGGSVEDEIAGEYWEKGQEDTIGEQFTEEIIMEIRNQYKPEGWEVLFQISMYEVYEIIFVKYES